jgi:ketosteroid isomerase-like protein
MLVATCSVIGLSAQARTDEALIRDARAASNAAIARHDLAGIAAVWMDNVHVTPSTSAFTDGRAENQKRMGEQFARRPDTIYIRTPSAIDVYAPWLVASERGDWVGKWTEPDGALEIGGTYLVQWRKVDGGWRIQSELYVPTHCKGSKYCSQRP